MNTKVTVQGNPSMEPVKVRALLANNNQVTQLSRRFATMLGLTEFRDVNVLDVFGFCPDWVGKWKISTIPITIWTREASTEKLLSYTCFPVINGNHSDAFWEMIIGQDIGEDGLYQMINETSRKRVPKVTATPGPSFQENVSSFGHNIRLPSKNEVMIMSTFIEYAGLRSSVLSRLAIHQANRQLIVVYHDSDRVYRYANLPVNLEAKLDDCIKSDGGSIEEVVNQVRELCPCEEIEEFPNSILIDGKL